MIGIQTDCDAHLILAEAQPKILVSEPPDVGFKVVLTSSENESGFLLVKKPQRQHFYQQPLTFHIFNAFLLLREFVPASFVSRCPSKG